MKAIYVLLFVAIVALATLLSPFIYKPLMEDDLTEKVNDLVAEKGLDGVNVQFDGHSLDLSTSVASAEQTRKVQEIADSVWGAYVGASEQVQLAPAIFSATEDAAGSVILRGAMPSDDARGAMVASAKKIPDVSVVDKMTVDSVTTPAWYPAIGGLVNDVVNRADEGHVMVDHQKLVVGGKVESQEIKDEILAAARAVPMGSASFEDRLEVEEWTDGHARIQRSDGNIVVSGLVPDQATKARLLTDVKSGAGDLPIVDRVDVGQRVRPVWWGQHAGNYVPKFFNGAVGDAWVEYTDPRVSSQATAPDAAGKGMLEGLAGNLPNGREATANITVAAAGPAPVPATKLATNLKELAVYFNSGSSWINKDGDGKIAKAAEVIKASGSSDAGLTVGGYADLTGNADSNRILSLERANAVRSKLVAMGVPASRLKVEYFGEDTSKVDPSEHWKSRRVEISITGAGQN